MIVIDAAVVVLDCCCAYRAVATAVLLRHAASGAVHCE
jgi:hypothetical protein